MLKINLFLEYAKLCFRDFFIRNGLKFICDKKRSNDMIVDPEFNDNINDNQTIFEGYMKVY
jgi:hypothetical protein